MARQLQQPNHTASISRNISIYDDAGTILGGIFQNGSLTHHDIYEMCSAFIVPNPANAHWAIFHLNADGSNADLLPNTNTLLTTGNYIILTPNAAPLSVSLNTESTPNRSRSTYRSSRLTPRKSYFRNSVRSRDDHCMITGFPNPMAAAGQYTSFEAAHIYPYAKEADWNRNGFRSLVSDNSSPARIGMSKINSPQNGILIFRGVHAQFDNFEISVKPDDNYKIISFFPQSVPVDGRTLEFRCRDPLNPNRVSDDLLRWHFRTAILRHMRGASGTPAWEMDFPEGDMLGEIRESPYAAERMEVELFNRLGQDEQVY